MFDDSAFSSLLSIHSYSRIDIGTLFYIRNTCRFGSCCQPLLKNPRASLPAMPGLQPLCRCKKDTAAQQMARTGTCVV